MKNRERIKRIKRYFHRLNGSTTEYNLKQYENLVRKIRNLESENEKRTDTQLKEMSQVLVSRAHSHQSLDDLLPEAYALVCEALKRILALNPFDVQVIGGIVLHQGKLAQMETGEGKTLTAVFPAYHNALLGKGVHVLTFNDYLARRDAEWMGAIYDFLGLTAGYVQQGMSLAERQRAYHSDVTYCTAKEAGFDFLRDSLCYEQDDRVHRQLHNAIIDEADSILIDEARIPLVIAGSLDDSIPDTYHMARIAATLNTGVDIELDEYGYNASLTDSGLRHVETLLGCDNVYAPEHIELLTRLNCAIHAE